ncbi:hypothetical protein L1887_59525 [Cichorium endivia]|nr:hypothetical protein L1887_59525 [Cichorium endivia]
MDLTNYMPAPLPPGSGQVESGSQRPPYRYDLYAVTHHFGSLNTGHYTATVKSSGEWWYCDDSRITRGDDRQLHTNSPYVLCCLVRCNPPFAVSGACESKIKSRKNGYAVNDQLLHELATRTPPMLNLHASPQGQTVETTSSPNPRERNGTANNGMSDYTALAHEPASIASLPTLTSTRPIPQS